MHLREEVPTPVGIVKGDDPGLAPQNAYDVTRDPAPYGATRHLQLFGELSYARPRVRAQQGEKLLPALREVGKVLCDAFEQRGILYTFGNGGSAADARSGRVGRADGCT